MKPDAALPGMRRVGYAFSCWLNRHPIVWRGAGALLRRWPVLSHVVPFVARHAAVTRALQRPASFLNTPHQPNLVAGDFMIAMPDDRRYRDDRALFGAMLAPLADIRPRSASLARERFESLAGQPVFDLVEDCLMGLMLDAVLPVFGAAGAAIVHGAASTPQAIAAERRRYLTELRHVAAQLFGGAGAPADVQMRAEAAAVSLRARIAAARPLLDAEPFARFATSPDALERTVVGMAWVSHPVTVQAGALAVCELLRRPHVYAALRARAQAVAGDPWDDDGLHDAVQAHLLECMRFHPVFPLLARDVPRDALFEAGAGRCPLRPAGSSLLVLTIAALFDRRRIAQPRCFLPGRAGGGPIDALTLMFGHGDRRCPGRDIALEVLTSALIGLLRLPRLAWAGPRWRRLRHDGPMIAAMPLRRHAAG